jgi:hypothetical protein
MCLVRQTPFPGGSQLDLDVPLVSPLGTEPVEINANSLQQVSFVSPPWDELVTACGNTHDFAALGPSTEDKEATLHTIVSIPLILADAEMNSVSKPPATLSVVFVVMMEDHGGLMEATYPGDKAMAHLKYGVQFRWAAHHKKLMVLNYAVAMHIPHITLQHGHGNGHGHYDQRIMPTTLSMHGQGPSYNKMMAMKSLTTLTETMTVGYMLAQDRDEKKTIFLRSLERIINGCF